MVLSVHIPKTAGVSVRNILKDHYGPGFCLHYWEITDAVGKVLPAVPRDATCVHGHFQTDQLTPSFPHATLITWVRDPIERVISSYHHRLREPDWRHPVCIQLHARKLSLPDYSALPLVRNEMTRFFGSKKPSDFAFIGVVEEFDRSLAALGRFLGRADLVARRDNANPQRVGPVYSIDPAERAAVEEHNALDVALYRECVEISRQH